MLKTCIIIPARYASTRFEGKPLVELCGKPMVLWVADTCAKLLGKDNVFVATDDERIQSVVDNSGYQSIMTGNCLTGTDRVAEAAKQIDADIYVNVQGDEPCINSADILQVIDVKSKNLGKVVNAYRFLTPKEDPTNSNIPKVVTTETNKLLYMSRSCIPGSKKDVSYAIKKQVCIYAFTIEELNLFYNFSRKSYLEKIEDIEILRFLDLDRTVLMTEVGSESVAVDCIEDVKIAEQTIRRTWKK